MTDKTPKPEADPRITAREASEAVDRAVEQAVYDRTHDKDGNPKPIVPEDK